jgi:alpha-L-fucosidase
MITGDFTRRGNTIYFHCNRWPGNEIAIGGLACKVKNVRFVDGPGVRYAQTGFRLVLQELPDKAPSELATVFEIEVDGPPYFDLPPYSCTIDDEACWSNYWRRLDKR